MSNNEPGLKLYGKLGFKEEGLIKKAYKLKDGSYIDEHRMAIFIK